MYRFPSFFVYLLICFASVAGFSKEPVQPRGRLLFLGVAYDEGLEFRGTPDGFNWAPDNFTSLLGSQSKNLFRDLKGEVLKGNQATRPALVDRLHSMQRTAKKEDVVLLYWGTHGGTNAKGWGANLPGDGIVYGTELKSELAKLPCPVIVAISTCGSGGFVHPRPNVTELPSNMAALCACQRKQSASNELDIALLEALAGFADLDSDGTVTLGETLEYVPKRYRRLMRNSPDADTSAVVGWGDKLPLDRPLTLVGQDHVAVLDDGVWYGATVQERMDGKTKVRFLGYDSTTKNQGYSYPDKVIENDRIDFAGGFPAVEVESEGTWYPAVILSERKKAFKIHYIGYPDTDDEVVQPKRIRYPFVPRTEAK